MGMLAIKNIKPLPPSCGGSAGGETTGCLPSYPTGVLKFPADPEPLYAYLALSVLAWAGTCSRTNRGGPRGVSSVQKP